MESLSRRRVLALAGLGLLSACGGPSAPKPRPSGATPTGGRPPRAADWQRLGRGLSGDVYTPGSSRYDALRLVENPRFDDNTPLAVLRAASARDVATAIAFAQDHDIPLAVRSGGHSYPGYSAGGAPGTGVPPSLTVDCRSMASVDVRGDAGVRIGAGAALAPIYHAVGGKGRAIAGGSCATVGIAGLSQGGGVGVLVRDQGLTCDAVTSMEVVTSDGKIRTASATQEPDLYWALRGGGGGHLGVVTSFTLSTFAAPTIHTFYLSWPLASAAEVIGSWQDWAPGADSRLWSTLKLLGGRKHPAGPLVLVSGTWVGDSSALDGQLSGLLAHVPAPTSRSTSTLSYLDAMMEYAGCADLPVTRCTTDPGGGLRREAFAATSHVAYRRLDSAGISDLIGRVDGLTSSGALTEAGISMDALGGRVGDIGPSDTAFVHRAALMTVQYTATFAGSAAARAQTYVRGFRSAMLPHWGNHAYVNYADAAVDDAKQAYFGANAGRLARVKRQYDPEGFFTQPQSY